MNLIPPALSRHRGDTRGRTACPPASARGTVGAAFPALTTCVNGTHNPARRQAGRRDRSSLSSGRNDAGVEESKVKQHLWGRASHTGRMLTVAAPPVFGFRPAERVFGAVKFWLSGLWTRCPKPKQLSTEGKYLPLAFFFHATRYSSPKPPGLFTTTTTKTCPLLHPVVSRSADSVYQSLLVYGMQPRGSGSDSTQIIKSPVLRGVVSCEASPAVTLRYEAKMTQRGLELPPLTPRSSPRLCCRSRTRRERWKAKGNGKFQDHSQLFS